MKIISIKAKAKEATIKEEIIFGGNNTFLFSAENTEGKTTYLRSIIFGMGFNVSTISEDFDRQHPTIYLVISIKDIKYTLVRTIGEEWIKITSINVNQLFNLNDESEANDFSNIYGFDNYDAFNSILGSIFIDQEFGWSTITNGNIHPDKTKNTKFKFPQLLYFLNNGKYDIDQIITNKQKINKKINRAKTIYEIFNTKKKDISIEEELHFNKVVYLTNEIDNINRQIINQKKSTKDLTKMIKLIDSNELLGNIFTNERKKLLNDIRGFDEKLGKKEVEWLKVIMKNKVKKQKQLIENDRKQISFYDANTKIDDIFSIAMKFNDIKGYEIDTEISFLEGELKKYEDELEVIKKENKVILEESFNTINDNIIKILGVETGIPLKSFINYKTNPIFNKISGAKKAFIILLTRMAIQYGIEKKYGLKVPFIIDTVVSFDPSEKSLKHLIDILKYSNKNHQLIIANVNVEINKQIIKKIDFPIQKEIKGEFKKENTDDLKFDFSGLYTNKNF